MKQFQLLKSSLALAVLLMAFTEAKSQIIFDIPGATGTYLTGINDSMDVCGYATYEGGLTRAFVKTKTDTIMLDYNSSFLPTWAGGVSNNGNVVCRYNDTGNSFDYHAYIYNIHTGGYTSMPQLDGYELLSPNDINDQGWISGDLKDGSQRRIFTYHPDFGMSTNFVMMNNEVKPTYGGHHIDSNGKCSAYWIDGVQHRGTFYNSLTSSFPGPIISIPDPIAPGGLKTQLMGGNEETILISHSISKTAYTYNLSTMSIGEKLRIPYATQVYAMDINEAGYIAGYYLDQDGIAHGFFQTDISRTFRPDTDGWSFVNSSWDCWNESIYAGNIDYASDDYWNVEHDEIIDFPLASDGQPYPSSQYLPWRTYVNIFGEEACYDIDPNVNYVEQNANAFYSWKITTQKDFMGICYGMTSIALLNYQDPELLFQRFPSMQETLEEDYPAYLSYETNLERTIGPCARGQWYQYSSESKADNDSSPFLEPIDYLWELYDEFLPGYSLHYRVTHIILQGEQIHGHHALVPYRISRDSSSINKYRVWVYDPNEPWDMEKYIAVTYSDTGSTYTYIFGNNELEPNKFGLRNMITRAPFVYQPTIPNYIGGYGDRDGLVSLTLGYSPDAVITSDAGGSIIINGLNYQNTIAESKSIDEITGNFIKSNKFQLPVGNYEIETTAVDSDPVNIFLNSNTGVISMSRAAEEDAETNHFSLEEEKLYYNNNSSVIKNINIHIIAKEDDMSIQYFVDNISINPGQSVGLQIITPTQVMITSNDASTTYDVRIRIFSPETGFWGATVTGIPIGTNVTQLIIPDLTDDTMDGITIETDANQDGTYEDSTSYDNEGIPNMMLSQHEVNAPNTGSEESIHVSNVGGGNLNWSVISSPEWIGINAGLTGVNHGPVQFTVAENNNSNGRQGYIIIQAAAPANEQDTVLVTQGQGTGVGIGKINLSDALVSMMPNPAKDYVLFSLSDDFSGAASYSIYNATGQLVRESKMHDKKEIVNTSELDRGIYQVKFNLNGSVVIKKLVLS